MKPRTVTLDDGREWLTDGISGIDCHYALKLLGLLKELAACNCSASFNNGILTLEDGSDYDLNKFIREASK